MTTPLAWAVLAAVWTGSLLPAGTSRSGWLLVLGATVLAWAAWLGRGGPPEGSDREVVAGEERVGTVRRLGLVLAGCALVGSGGAGARLAWLDAGPLARAAADGGAVTIRARVMTDVRETRHGGWQLLRVSAVDGRRAAARALLRLGDDSAAPLGAVVTGRVTAQPLTGDGFEAHLRRLSTGVAVTPQPRLTVAADPPMALLGTTRFRGRTAAAFRSALPPDRAALLTGLVTGDVTGLPPGDRDALVGAGLSHLVAVSGSNVALVLAGTVGISVLLGFGARGRRRLAAAAVLWFVVLVRGEPPVLRAAAMALVVIAASATGRGSEPRHALAVAATVLLLVDPLLAGQLGFALSVLATAGVLVAGPAVAGRMPGPRPLRLLVGASLGAQAGVAPVLLVWMGAVPLASLPANLIAVPAAALASALGVTAALLAQVWSAAGEPVARVAGPAVGVILASAAIFADGPQLQAPRSGSAAGMWLVAALAAAAACMAARRRGGAWPGGRRAVAAGVALAVLTAVVPVLWPRAPVTALTLTALDVGQGDALLVEAPGVTGAPPARMLVDGGPDPALALRLLRRAGVQRLDVVAASHPHADHTEGLPAVLERLDVGALVVPPMMLDARSGLTSSARDALTVARSRAVPTVPAAGGGAFALGSARVDVLGPPADGSLGSEPNDNSLVLRVSDHRGSLLLAGDAEEAAQRRLLREPQRLRATVLKVAHHGGNTNATGFIDAVGAPVAVVSVGAGNDYGHPHPAVLAELAGRDVRRTDRDGTVIVSTASAPVAMLAPASTDEGRDGRLRAPAAATGAHRPAGRTGRGAAYTARHAACRPVPRAPARRTPGAAAAASGRAGARRAAPRRLPRRRGPAGVGPPRRRPARPADRFAVR